MAYRTTEYTEAEEARIRQQFTADPKTGIVTRTTHMGVSTGSFNEGYIMFKIKRNGKSRYEGAHNILWFLTYGYWPHMLDHINRNRADNRLCNLREVSGVQNNHNRDMLPNNTSGAKGVHWDNSNQRWKAFIDVNSRRIFLIASKKEGICIQIRQRIESYVQAKLEENIVPTRAEVLAERDRIKKELVQ